jgi:cation:H+ antiporter
MVLLPGAAIVAGALAMSDQVLTRPEGALLVGAYLFYIAFVVQEGRAAQARAEDIRREATESPRLPPLVLLLGGLVLVYAGATTLVSGGIRLLDRTSLTAGFVGAAIVGALAAMDEVFLEVVPVLRDLPELATGNLFGTIAAFTTGALGLAALIRPLEIDSAANSAFLAIAVLYAIVSVPFLARGKAGRLTGLLLMIAYAVWLALASRL